MTPRSASLEEAVAAHLAHWDPPHVELAIHGTGDARAIALAINAFCDRELGSAVVRPVFYRSSVGAVAGVTLADGRTVVIKAHQPEVSSAHLRDVLALQARLAGTSGIAPTPIAGPAPLGAGLATVEEYRADGAPWDGHDPIVARALAHGLSHVIERLEAFAGRVALRAIELPNDSLWPVPHSRQFDFAASTRGAAYIDDLAATARRRMNAAGRRVITHGDWRAEHVRFDGDTLVVAYDWDSLCLHFEPAAVGATAHMFCADWSREDVAQAPSLDEARAFLADYEAARGRAFTKDERRSCGAWFTYSVAYTARCGHAGGVDLRDREGNHQHLIAALGTRLLEL